MKKFLPEGRAFEEDIMGGSFALQKSRTVQNIPDHCGTLQNTLECSGMF
jgi:hypothetical protein